MNGKCNCGAVSFELLGEMPSLYQCHCTLCQKQGGTASNAGTIVYLNNFRWKSGENQIQRWTKDTGFSSHFCRECGSPVPNVFKTDYVWIPVGLIDEVSTDVVAHLWLSSKPAWESPVEKQRNYDTQPENLEEFIQFLNGGRT